MSLSVTGLPQLLCYFQGHLELKIYKIMAIPGLSSSSDSQPMALSSPPAEDANDPLCPSPIPTACPRDPHRAMAAAKPGERECKKPRKTCIAQAPQTPQTLLTEPRVPFSEQVVKISQFWGNNPHLG